MMTSTMTAESPRRVAIVRGSDQPERASVRFETFRTGASAQRLIELPDGFVTPQVIAVCASGGGIPKLPLCRANVTFSGIEGDAHAHDKHNRPDRAISLFDFELLNDLVAEGFSLRPGSAGENLTVAGLHVQSLPVGTRLRIGEVVLQLEEPRKPCYVLDAIDERLKTAIVGRCGFMASVVQAGVIHPEMEIAIEN